MYTLITCKSYFILFYFWPLGEYIEMPPHLAIGIFFQIAICKGPNF